MSNMTHPNRTFPIRGKFLSAFALVALGILLLPGRTPVAGQEAPPTETPPGGVASVAEVEKSSEPTPVEAEVFLSQYDPAKSFSKLLLPYIAQRIGLTDSQKTEVTRLMDERSTKLAAAANDRTGWPKIVQESEAALKAVLSPQQLERFEQSLADKKITLRFSKARWEDVLKWMANELGLQLVMDAPPPGTFDYNDKNAYTPKEALDIINGRLGFLGYYLFRTGEMLYLHNFKTGALPINFIPKITPEQLPEQSRFDYVALTIPLERRSMDAVLEAIKPFLGPYNTSRTLSGNTLMITDSVNALREILPVALGVNNPSVPGPPAPAPRQEWKTWTLTKTKPQAIDDIVTKFTTEAKSLYNPAAKEISYLAIPPILDTIGGLIERLEAGADPTNDLSVAVYPLQKIIGTSRENLPVYSRRMGNSAQSWFTDNVGEPLMLGTEIAAGFQKIAPTAHITLNPLTKQMVVVAAPDDQQKIAEAVEKLASPIGPEEKTVFKTYRFVDSSKTLSQGQLSTLRTMIPLGQISFDDTNGTLLVVGTAADQEKAAQAVADMNADYLEQDEQQSLAIFPMTSKQLAQFTTIFANIASTPEMKGVVRIADGSVNQLSIWAKPRQMEKIRRIVEQVTLAVRAIAESSATNENLSPEGAAGPDGDASPSSQAVSLTETGETPSETSAHSPPRDYGAIPGGVPGVYLDVIPLNKTSPYAVSSMLPATIPGIEVTLDPYGQNLIVYGTRPMITAARRLVDELERGRSIVLEIVPYTNMFPFETVSALRTLEPEIALTDDPKGRQFFLVGRQENVKRLRAAIESILAVSPPQEESIYYLDVRNEIPYGIVEYVKRIVPKSQVEYDTAARRFTIIGTPTDQLTIAKLIIDADNNLPAKEETRYYTWEKRIDETLIALVREAVPAAQNIRRDENNPKVLIVTARPPIQDNVAAALERIKSEIPEKEENTLVVYSIDPEQYRRFEQLRPDFERENGTVRVLSDQPDQLMVWAMSSQQEKLGDLIQQIKEGYSAEENKKTAQFYSPKYVEGATLASVVTDLFPEVAVTHDTGNNKLILRGKAARVAEAKETLAGIDVKDTDGLKRHFSAYNVKSMTSYDKNGNYYSPIYLVRDLQQLTPAAKVSYEIYQQQILVWGTDEEHEIITEAIGNLNQTTSFGDRMMRHEIRRGNPSTLVSLVQQIFPRATVTLDSTANSIIVQGNQVAMDEVREFFETIDPENPSPLDPMVATFPFTEEPTETIVETLKKLTPEATITIDKNQNQLMVVARPSEMKILRENIDRVSQTFRRRDLRMIPYPVYGMKPAELKTSLEKSYPEVTVDLDTSGNRLLVRASLDEHVKISEEIERVNGRNEDGSAAEYAGPKVAVYLAPNSGLAYQLQTLVKTMFPSAEIAAETSYYGTEQKIVIQASSREQKKIAELFEQLKNPLNEEIRVTETFPLGQIEPTTAEIAVLNILNKATSASPYEVQAAVSRIQQYIYYNRGYNPTGQTLPFIRVDPVGKTVSVFGTEKERDQVRDSLERMNLSAVEPSLRASKVYPLASPIASALTVPLKRLIPTAEFSVSSASELIVFGSEEEIAKADGFLREIEEREGGETHYRYKAVFLPEGSLYDRSLIISTINGAFTSPRVYAYAGANANQIVLWGYNKSLRQVEEYLNEACSATEPESYKTYSVRNIAASTAIGLLTKLCPNVTVTPNEQNRTVTVFGSAFEQTRVAAALAEIDSKKSDGNEFTVRYYTLDGMIPGVYWPIYYTVYYYMTAQFPTATLLVDDVYRRSFVVIAPEECQEKIGELFEEAKEQRLAVARHLEPYQLESVNFTKVMSILPLALPTVTVFGGKRPSELFVWGTPLEQEQVRELLTKLETTSDTPSGFVPKLYHIESPLASTAAAQLATSIPTATVTAVSGNRILVWGSEADHKLADEVLGVFGEAYPERVLTRYGFKHIRMNDAYSFLYPKHYPDAIIYPSADGELWVQAPRELQEKIAQEIHDLDAPQDEDAAPFAKAYDISEIPVASLGSAVSNILTIVPGTVFLPTVTPGYYVIYARADDHKKITQLVSQLLKEQPWLKARTVRYSLRNISYAEAVVALRPIAPTAQFTPGREPNQMYVWAKASEQDRIAEMLDKMNEPVSDGLVTRIYRLDRASLDKANTTLLTLYPGEVTSLVDAVTRTITVKATAEYQEKVHALMDELDRLDTATQPSVRVFALADIAYTSISGAISTFYAADPSFQMYYDPNYRSLTVRGVPEQISFVENIIEQVRQGGLAEPGLSLKTYTFQNPWSIWTIYYFFSQAGHDLYMFRDYYSTGKMIALARPEQHKIIESLLEKLAPEKTKLAIFELVAIEPTTAYSIITSMLENDGTFIDIQYDASSNRLYIRATPTKLEEIRQFLIQAGEKSLEKMRPIDEGLAARNPLALGGATPSTRIQETGPVRTLRVEGDLGVALEKIEKSWPRDNPLTILKQNDPLIQDQSDALPNAQNTEPVSPPSEEATLPSDTPPDMPSPDAPTAPDAEKTEPVSTESNDEKEKTADSTDLKITAALQIFRAFLPLAMTQALVAATPTEPTTEAELPAQTEPATQAAPVSESDAPTVYVVWNEDGTVTITSRDTEALDAFQNELLTALHLSNVTPSGIAPSGENRSNQFIAPPEPTEEDKTSQEKQIRYMARQNAEAGRAKLVMEDRKFSVYKVEQVAVDTMIDRLTIYMSDRINPPASPFSSRGRGISMQTISSGPRLTFSPDRLLNTIMVTGSKVDREEVGAMIAALDRPELFPQPITKPFKVPVKNTNVTKMAQRVLSAFQQKFTSTRLPGGLLPRVSPNTESNTLEIFAPEDLAKEIAEYVKETDQEILDDPNRKQVQVVKLKEISSTVLQKYITDLRAATTPNNFSNPYTQSLYQTPYNYYPMPRRQF